MNVFLEVAADLWQRMWDTPWLAVLIVALVVAACVRRVRAVVHGLRRPDPVRRFSAADRATILSRAGNRCEYHHVLSGRCSEREGLEADHVHPHSRGGWTDVTNGQALCRRHNRSKSASVPWNRQLERLAKRRSGYFPVGQPTTVTRYATRSRRG